MSTAEENTFRDQALEAAMTHLAPLFVQFQGLGQQAMCFNVWETSQLRLHLAKTLATFIAETPVEPIGPEREELQRPGRHSIEVRQLYIDAERSRLEKAGLTRSEVRGTDP